MIEREIGEIVGDQQRRKTFNGKYTEMIDEDTEGKHIKRGKRGDGI